MQSTNLPGGFIHDSLPSPAPSNSSTLSYHPLPHPRASPLKPGSRHESALISFLDDQLLQISRKYAKKFSEGGYTSIKEVVADAERIVDVIWISSTPTLQTHYLLQIANSFNDYLASFPAHLPSTFQFLDKLDRCFYILITGVSPIPTSPSSATSSSGGVVMMGYRMNTTEKVRLKSVVERTRLHVVKLFEAIEEEEGVNAEDVNEEKKEMEEETEKEDDGEDEDEEWRMEVARVYDRTMIEVGESLKRDA